MGRFSMIAIHKQRQQNKCILLYAVYKSMQRYAHELNTHI